MIDPNGVAVSNGVQDLQESVLGQRIVADELSSLGDVGKEVTLGAKFDDNKSAIRTIQDSHQRNDVGMLAGFVVQFNLSLLEPPLPRVESSFGQGFDGVRDVCVDIDGGVDHSICSNAENRGKLQPAG